MLSPAAEPALVQFALDLVMPPVAAGLFRLMARNWAATVQGDEISEQTKSRQKLEFWVLLIALYVLCFGITIYGLIR